MEARPINSSENTPSSVSQFTGVPVDHVGDVWNSIRPMILQMVARSKGRMTERGLLDAILAAESQLWLSYRDDKPEALMLTEIVTVGTVKTCKMFAATGHNRQHWAGFLGVFEEWARSEGCQVVEAIARPGWEKVLSEYKKTHVVLEKDLTNGR